MKQFNLSEWALRHKTLVLYFLFALIVAGIISYRHLAQKEDPDFTFKVMTLTVKWPGATAREVEQQVTNQIEGILQETPWLDNVSSYSKAGEAVIFVTLKDSMPPGELQNAWNAVRRKVSDLKGRLPDDVLGPFVNDEFGQTFGSIYAFTSNTLSNSELVRLAYRARREILRIEEVGKVDVIGAQREQIYIEFSSAKLAALGIDPLSISETLKAQNAMEPAGQVVTPYDVTEIRVSGDFNSTKSIQDIGIHSHGKIHRLGDIANVYRGYVDPATFKMRYRGEEAVGLAVSMSSNGSRLRKNLEREINSIRSRLPAGVELHQVSDQPSVVKKSIGEFMRSLLEALVIVLAVSFLSLGLRAGLVVALSIPIVLAGTFLFMKIFDIDLQRVSLGALIIALGLLVDDAMIAVEMMKVKLDQGWNRIRAASFAYTSTAFPMLTGTLITAAAFLPVGLAKSSAGEYTISICAVITIALLVSWIVAVIFAPFIGCRILRQHPFNDSEEAHYQRGFYVKFRKMVVWCLTHRNKVIALTLAAFLLSLLGFSRVEQQFFPPSDRPELLMDVWLPEETSFATTENVVQEIEKRLKAEPGIVKYTSYVGGSTPRFYLPLDLQLPMVNYAQIVILTQDLPAREKVLANIRKIIDNEYQDSGIRISRLENGPPVGYPIQFKVIGEDIKKIKEIALKVAQVVRENKNTKNVSLDSQDKLKTINVEVDQEKARMNGLSSQTISRNLQAFMSGLTVTHYREGYRRIEVTERVEPSERENPDALGQMGIYTESGKLVPLSEVAKIREGLEDGIIWRENRMPVVTVRADIHDGIEAPDVSAAIDAKLAGIRAALPDGYSIEVGGAMADSDKATESIVAVLPLTALIIVTLLMLQLRNFSLLFIVLLTAPLGIIGVTLSLLLFKVPFGFVAMLGMVSLAGMIMRNSVILVDQIEQDMRAGLSAWDSIVESTVRRARPIMLTAAAAILAMIPLAGSAFWGSMAIVIMGGLLVATLLTLIFLPALYAAWFRVKKPQ